MAGKNPGDVAIHNSHFRVGGAAGTLVRHPDAGGHCGGPPESCKAAWGMLHLTPTSSAYISNMWGWTADHDIDAGQSPPVISTGRGALIEARNGTWLIGTAFEHNTLYQYNFNLANDVASVFQQSETPYWQGPGNDMAPAPWKPNLVPSDPTFQTCGTNALCAMAWFEIITGSNNIFLYGGCVWVFFNNNILGCNTCQGFGIEVNDSIGVYLYGINTKSITEMIVSDNGKAIAHSSSNPGGSWGSDSQGKTITGGVIAAYLFNVFET
jgi:glucan 1,3-beta-glucosidase